MKLISVILQNLGESITSRESQVRAHQRKRKKLSIESDKEDPFIKFVSVLVRILRNCG